MPIALAVILVGSTSDAGAKPTPKGVVSKGVGSTGGALAPATELPRARKVRKPNRAYETFECPKTMHVRVDTDVAKKDGDFTSSYQAVMDANVGFDQLYVYEDGEDYLMQCMYVSSVNGITFYGVQDRQLSGKGECFEIAGKAGCYGTS